MAAKLLEQLAEFVAATDPEQIPSDVKHQAKVRMVDFLAALAMGMSSGVKNFIMDTPLCPDLPQATVLFSGKKLNGADAAACNSYIATSSGMEDGSRYAGAHPSSGIIPPSIAAAEITDASGDAVLTAVVLAYEVHLRIGYAIYPHVLAQRFHSSAILAPLGAAAAVGKLIRLTPDELAAALAIACLSSAGLVCAFDAYPAKCFQIARAVKGGFDAALLAKRGMPGPVHALEDGFLKAYGGTDTLDLSDLGKRFLVGESYLKIHGGCRHIHPAIDAAMDIRNTDKVLPEDIADISVKITSAAHAMERENAQTYTDARFNTPILVAAGLTLGEVSDAQITDALLNDGTIKSLCERTRVAVDPELDVNFPRERGVKLTLTLKDGRTCRRQLKVPLGEPENPLPDAAVKTKFSKALAGILPPDRISFLYDFLMGLEQQENLTPFLNAILKK